MGRGRICARTAADNTGVKESVLMTGNVLTFTWLTHISAEAAA